MKPMALTLSLLVTLVTQAAAASVKRTVDITFVSNSAPAQSSTLGNQNGLPWAQGAVEALPEGGYSQTFYMPRAEDREEDQWLSWRKPSFSTGTLNSNGYALLRRHSWDHLYWNDINFDYFDEPPPMGIPIWFAAGNYTFNHSTTSYGFLVRKTHESGNASPFAPMSLIGTDGTFVYYGVQATGASLSYENILGYLDDREGILCLPGNRLVRLDKGYAKNGKLSYADSVDISTQLSGTTVSITEKSVSWITTYGPGYEERIVETRELDSRETPSAIDLDLLHVNQIFIRSNG